MKECEEKVWGRTIELFHNNTTSTHYLEIKAGGYCSEHKHAQKANIFFIIEGKLEITEWPDAPEHITILKPGDVYAVPTDIWHRFRAIIDVKCIEIYNYMYDGKDIKRRTVGGLDDVGAD